MAQANPYQPHAYAQPGGQPPQPPPHNSPQLPSTLPMLTTLPSPQMPSSNNFSPVSPMGAPSHPPSNGVVSPPFGGLSNQSSPNYTSANSPNYFTTSPGSFGTSPTSLTSPQSSNSNLSMMPTGISALTMSRPQAPPDNNTGLLMGNSTGGGLLGGSSTTPSQPVNNRRATQQSVLSVTNGGQSHMTAHLNNNAHNGVGQAHSVSTTLPGRPPQGPPVSPLGGRPSQATPGKPPPGPPSAVSPTNHTGPNTRSSPMTRYNGRGRPNYPKRPAVSISEPSQVKRAKKDPPKQHNGGGTGSSCHQCKSRRAQENLIFCTHVMEKTNKGCRKKYCEHCLRKFYGEELSEIPGQDKWHCPSCRRVCCCAACRRREQKEKEPDYDIDSKRYDNIRQGSSKGYRGAKGRSARIRDNPERDEDGDYSDGEGDVSALASGSIHNNFALLYCVAQMPNVRSHIHQIISRENIDEKEKVELIASLLRSAVRASGARVVG